MKKDLMKTMLLMLCAMFAFTFTACSDDDDPADAATQVAGSYSGNLEVFMGGESLTTAQKTISLTRKTATTVDLVINNFTLDIPNIGSVDLGKVTIDCSLTESGNGYMVAGTILLPNVTVPVENSEEPLVVDCTVTLNGATVNGTTFNMPLTIGVMYGEVDFGTLVGGITATFTGTK